MKIDGKKIAAEIKGQLREEMDSRRRENDKLPILAAIKVGKNPASESFLKIKKQTAAELGADFRIYELAEDLSGDKLRAEVGRIANQKAVGGVIIQLPLPEKFNRQRILNAVPAEKDVDVLSERAWASFMAGKSQILPPAVGVVLEILKYGKYQMANAKYQMSSKSETKNKESEGWFKNLRVVVVGMGFLTGRPVLAWLAGKAQELLVLDQGSDLARLDYYDLVVSGVGKAGLIKPEYLKVGAGVIDFGYDGGRGDLDASKEGDLKKLAFWTPTPGGTGPILVAKLFENFLKLTEESRK